MVPLLRKSARDIRLDLRIERRCIGNTGQERTGDHVSITILTADLETPHNKPVRLLSVEIEEALKAEHCDDWASDMQPWAMAVGIETIMAPNVKRRVCLVVFLGVLRGRCEVQDRSTC